MCILASVLNYFSLLGVCLKTKMKMSANSILRLYDRIRYYIDSIATGYETMVRWQVFCTRNVSIAIRDLSGSFMRFK